MHIFPDFFVQTHTGEVGFFQVAHLQNVRRWTLKKHLKVREIKGENSVMFEVGAEKHLLAV